MVKDNKMISFSWCDWSWKSSLIDSLLKLQKYNHFTVFHYYDLVKKLEWTKDSGSWESKKAKKWKTSFITITKEYIYAIILFLYLVYWTKVKGRYILLDRTYIDVYIDLTCKSPKHLHLYTKGFKIIDKIFLKIYKRELHFFLETDSYKTNFKRKPDESNDIYRDKFRLYSKIPKNNHIIINTEKNSIKESIWKIKSLSLD